MAGTVRIDSSGPHRRRQCVIAPLATIPLGTGQPLTSAGQTAAPNRKRTPAKAEDNNVHVTQRVLGECPCPGQDRALSGAAAACTG